MGKKLTEQQKAERRFKMKLKKAKAAKARLRAAIFEEAFGFPPITAKPYQEEGVKPQIIAARKKETTWHNSRPRATRKS